MKREQLQTTLLKAFYDNESRRLNNCLEEIDHKLLDCSKYLEEYHRTRLALRTINERLSRLGAQTLPVADQLPADGLGEIINNRLQHFRSAGKL
ncbi:MAG: hypothetical protein GEU77_09855 [Deltaproteobacteria bacterium]|nr:hypothetical protein [Deltaproteobacteria bacterium]